MNPNEPGQAEAFFPKGAVFFFFMLVFFFAAVWLGLYALMVQRH